MATSSRIRAADEAFAAVKRFYLSSRDAERRFDPEICDFTSPIIRSGFKTHVERGYATPGGP